MLGILVAVASAAVVNQASAVSLIDVATSTAIGSGWTNLQDTVLAILGAAWAPMLGIAAVMAGPRIVKGMMKLATGH